VAELCKQWVGRPQKLVSIGVATITIDSVDKIAPEVSEARLRWFHDATSDIIIVPD
jgi:hypothetical protein